MARQREEQVQAIDKYGTGLFYGAGPERPRTSGSNNLGATYSNGQARPVAVLPISRPVPKVQPVSNRTDANPVRNENWRQDQVALSLELRDLRNGAAWTGNGSGNTNSTQDASYHGGTARGPVYSDNLRRTLDTLLLGT